MVDFGWLVWVWWVNSEFLVGMLVMWVSEVGSRDPRWEAMTEWWGVVTDAPDGALTKYKDLIDKGGGGLGFRQVPAC